MESSLCRTPLRTPGSPSPAWRAGRVSGEERPSLGGAVFFPEFALSVCGKSQSLSAIAAFPADGVLGSCHHRLLSARSRNLTAFPGGTRELLLRDLDQLFLASDCRHFNRTESLRCAAPIHSVLGSGTERVSLGLARRCPSASPGLLTS